MEAKAIHPALLVEMPLPGFSFPEDSASEPRDCTGHGHDLPAPPLMHWRLCFVLSVLPSAPEAVIDGLPLTSELGQTDSLPWNLE